MACFLVPAAEAVVTVIIRKAVLSKEKKSQDRKANTETTNYESAVKIPFSRKLKWLSNLLFGGSILLAFEHVWHGEVLPWFPFLTAANNSADASIMLHEMATIGATMALLVTAVWLGMLAVTSVIMKRPDKPLIESATE